MTRWLMALSLLFLCTTPAVADDAEATAARILEERGRAFLEDGKLAEAERQARAAFRLRPDDGKRLLLGRVLAQLKRCDEALPLLHAADPKGLPKASRKAAASDLGAALESCGSSPEQRDAAALLMRRGRDRIDVKQYEQARDDLEKALAIAPTDETEMWLAVVYQALGMTERALRLYRQVDLDALPATLRVDAKKRVAEGIEACSAPPIDMVYIAAGVFDMGSTSGAPDEQPVHTVSLPAYYIDRTEVTVGRFEECVTAGACSRSHFVRNEDKPYCNFGEPTRRDHPMNCVDWQGATEFCTWLGRRLPTEAEWEHAAGGRKPRAYPWGEEEPSCHLAVMKGESDDGCGEDRTWPVGSRAAGVSEFGLFDMAGNVWEWVADWYDERYYAVSPGVSPKGPDSGTRRVMRGGSWLSDAGGGTLRCANRDHDAPEFVGNGVGFRCARDADDTPPEVPAERPPAH